MTKTLIFFVTLGPIGYFKGSGTYASFIALIIGYIVNFVLGGFYTFLLAFLITLVGFFLTAHYLKFSNKKDPPEVVIDEVAGQFFAMCFVGISIELSLISFLIFRFLDIFKPYPINKLELLPGAFGVMADDVFAGIITIFFIIFIKNLILI
ncbi:MAG: hypothetical protein CMP38_01345 [Rickettsiales bacterium]|nr:hypothetical protein [Rickettsiales bacterium]OUW05500.1 MAG: hypothetical protein CBD16_00965 [Betaproteobacteria bacterium TMED156]